VLALAVLATVARVFGAFLVGLFLVVVVGGLSFLLWPLMLTLRGQGGGMVWLFGLGMGMRLSCILLGGMLLLLTTRTEEVLAAFSRLGMPFPAVFSIGLTFRLVPALLANARNVVEAQRLRGLKFDSGGIITRTKRYVPLLVPVLATSLRSAHRMSWALEAKGFGSAHARSPYIVLRMRAADWLVLAFSVAAFIAAVWARFAGMGVLPFRPL
jgi:energy-coupling factor transport system permease protein